LENFGVDSKVAKWCIIKAINDGVSNVTDTRLKWIKVLWKTSVLDFVGEEFDNVAGNGTRIFVGAFDGTAWEDKAGFDKSSNLSWVNLDRKGSNSGAWRSDIVWFAWWGPWFDNIVASFE